MEEKQKIYSLKYCVKCSIIRIILRETGGIHDSWENRVSPYNASSVFLYCMQNGLFHDCEGCRRLFQKENKVKNKEQEEY